MKHTLLRLQKEEKYKCRWMECRYFWEQHDAEDKLMACCKKNA